MARKLDPKSKAGFVRSCPTTLSAQEVVAKAKAAGLTIDDRYVYAVRSTAKAARRKKRTAVTAAGVPAERAELGATQGGGGILAEIERVVERKVTAMLEERLQALFRR